MSTFISLVIVGGCIGAVTWMVLREDGQPATDAAVRRRAAQEKRRQRRAERRTRRADERASRAATAAAAQAEAQLQAQADARAAAEAEATAVVQIEAPAAPPPEAAPAPATRPARGAVRAPETVKGRRRDVGGVQGHRSQPVLVPPEDVPAPEPARSTVVHRLRSGAGLLVLLVVLGAGVALAIGLVADTIADALQRSVS